MAFLRTAGTTIMAICVVMWWLSAYPRVDSSALAAEATPSTATAERATEFSKQGDAGRPRAAIARSYAGQLGHTLQPLFSPLGFDWQLTMGVLTSFLAREVLVSTLSVLASGANDTNADAGVIARIQGMRRDDGSPVFTTATAASTLVFFVMAMQCLPTLAVTRKETGGWRYPAFQFAYMSGVAYGAAFIVYQGVRAAGFS